ncbi:MAG: energy-coupled thiamine transporter ThiT [Defluviitaleaceae bacterium]|nr:energy-coupled thiamine transporter ThiT [Defluviitaleaceae bacterium]
MYDAMSGTKKLTVAAMCIALAFVLNQVTLFRMPMGGSITPASMLFIVLAGYWLGPIYGVIAGVGKGFLDLTTGFVNVHPVQVLLDYPMAFGMLGLAGLFRKMNFGLQVGYIVGVLGRLLMVFISGLVFFVDVTGLGLVGGAIASFTYNITYIGPEMMVTLVIISLPTLRHAIDAVTKGIVSPEDYIAITRRNRASISAGARLATGMVMGALGGLAFVVVSHLTRLENLSIAQLATGVNLFAEEPSRLYRLVERNTGHIVGLQVVGVLFVALGIGLVFSVLMRLEESKVQD